MDACPDCFWRLTALEELYIDRNQIADLPDGIGELVNLKELGLIGNKLKTVPTAINKLAKLEVLHAEENRLESLPKGLGKLQSLKKIYMQVRVSTRVGSFVPPSSIGPKTKEPRKFAHCSLLTRSMPLWNNCVTNCLQDNKLQKLVSGLGPWVGLLL